MSVQSPQNDKSNLINDITTFVESFNFSKLDCFSISYVKLRFKFLISKSNLGNLSFK